MEEEENSSKEVGLKSSLTINGANSFKRNRPQTDVNKKVKIKGFALEFVIFHNDADCRAMLNET